MRYLNKLLLAITLVITCNFSWAGPPFVTDDPDVVEYKHWEVNYAVNKTWAENEYSVGIPSIDINYGFSENIQLHIQPKYSYVRAGLEKYHGVDSTEIGVKYRFINQENETSNFMVSFYPLVQLPTGDEKLGEERNKFQSFLPLWLQYDTQDWTFYGGLGYRINQYTDNKNSWFYGTAALYHLTKTLQMGAEAFYETSTGTGEKHESGFNVGGIYDFTDDYHLLFSAGRGLNDAKTSNQLSTYLALQVLY